MAPETETQCWLKGSELIFGCPPVRTALEIQQLDMHGDPPEPTRASSQICVGDTVDLPVHWNVKGKHENRRCGQKCWGAGQDNPLLGRPRAPSQAQPDVIRL